MNGHSSTRELAAALRRQAKEVGTTTPSVRGSDWQTATVTAVNSDGTVAVGDIPARRIDTYGAPQVGDRIMLTQESGGNWLACGRIVPAAGDAWLPLTLSGTWVANGGVTDAPPCARITPDGKLELSGMIKGVAVNASANASIGTLPAGIATTYWIRGLAPTSVTLNYARIDINPTGAITMVNGSVAITAAGWVELNPIRGRAR